MTLPPLAKWIAFTILGLAAVAGGRTPAVALWTVAYVAASVVGATRRSWKAGARARGHRDAEAGARERPLRAGPFVLAGRVAYAEEQPEAMRVEIVQEGSENVSSGTWSHQWNEVDRTLTVHPFYVVRDDGERILVEPTPDGSQLFDDLEDKVPVGEDLQTVSLGSRPQRTRFATLMPDEHVWVTGELDRAFNPEGTGAAAQAGYRESAGPTSWVMRGDPTLLVSSVSLVSDFRSRSQRHASHAFLLLFVLVVPLLIVARYVDRDRGATVTGTVTSVDEVRDRESGRLRGYRARTSHLLGTSDSETLARAPEIGSTMPFRVGEYSANEGTVARMTGGELGLSYMVCVFGIVACCMSTRSATRSLPWYRSDKVKLTESGQGRLPGGA